MVIDEWTIKYTPQTEWIERRGILVWIAETFTSLGAGLYLVSLYFDSLWGLFIGWLIIVVLKIPFHLAYFGKPFRFWRTIPPFTDAWRTSWFTRGITFTVLFTGFGLLQLAFSYWLPGTGWEIVFKVLAGITAFLVGIYSGFIMNYVKGIPFWNSALLPVVFILGGVLDGCALLIATALFGASVNIMAVEAITRILLVANAFIIAIYLLSATYTEATAKESVVQLIRGRVAASFWIGVVILGIIIPFVISISSYFVGEASSILLIVAVISHTLGAFALKYCLLKVGIHKPVLPVSAT